MLTQGKTLVDAAKKAGVHQYRTCGCICWDTTDDIPYILGRPPKTFRDFLAENKDMLVASRQSKTIAYSTSRQGKVSLEKITYATRR